MSRFTNCKYVAPATEGKYKPSDDVRQRKGMAMGGSTKTVPPIPTPFKKSGKTA